MKIRKLLALILAMAFVIGAITACGGAPEDEKEISTIIIAGNNVPSKVDIPNDDIIDDDIPDDLPLEETPDDTPDEDTPDEDIPDEDTPDDDTITPQKSIVGNYHAFSANWDTMIVTLTGGCSYYAEGGFENYGTERRFDYIPGQGIVDRVGEGSGVYGEYGTYTFDGTTLVETVLYWDDGEVPEPYTNTYKVTFGEGFIRLNDGEKLYAGDTPEEAFAYFLADHPEAPTKQPEGNSIVGSYYCTIVDLETMLATGDYSWTFNQDGTFETCDTEVTYYYSFENGLTVAPELSGGGSQYRCGTYTLEGTTLTLTYTYIEHEEELVPYTKTLEVTFGDGYIQLWGTLKYYIADSLEEAAHIIAAQQQG